MAVIIHSITSMQQAASSKEQGQWRQTLGGCDSRHAAGVKDHWPQAPAGILQQLSDP